MKHGFRPGRYSPCTFFHTVMNVKVLVHGDDFVSVGSAASLKWFRRQLDARFELKTSVIGPQEELKEIRILNRVIRLFLWSSSSIFTRRPSKPYRARSRLCRSRCSLATALSLPPLSGICAFIRARGTPFAKSILCGHSFGGCETHSFPTSAIWPKKNLGNDMSSGKY